MNTLHTKCQEIILISNQYTKNLKKLLSDDEKIFLQQYNGNTISEMVYNYLNKDTNNCYCGKKTRFFSVAKGYATFCSKSCQSKYRESNWSDEMKEHRSKTISKSVKAIWDDPNNKDWLEKRNDKIAITSKKMWVEASDDWKQDRSNILSNATTLYAINNPLEVKERAQKARITRLNKSDAENEIIYQKHIKTKIKNGSAIPKHLKSDFKVYTSIVWRYTERNYKKYYHEINPTNIIRSYKGFHLDHKLSIFEAFSHHILPSIVGSKFNLELITSEQNHKKQRHSSTTIKELLSLI